MKKADDAILGVSISPEPQTTDARIAAAQARAQQHVEEHAIDASLRVANDFTRLKHRLMGSHASMVKELQRERRMRALQRWTMDEARAAIDPLYKGRKLQERDNLKRELGLK